MTNKQRIPRPIGITELGKLYNLTQLEDHYQSLHQKVIHHYIRNNFSYCGIYYNVEQFSKVSGIKEIDLMKGITSYGKELGELHKGIGTQDLFRAISQISLSWVLEDRSAVQQQLAIMQSSQGNSYKPFISSEVGKTMKLAMDANNNLLSLMKSMGTPSSLIPIDSDASNGPREKGITADEAVRIFKENRFTPLLENDAQLSNLAREYDIDRMPEVNALLQIGMDTSKEGLTIQDITKIDSDMLSKFDKVEATRQSKTDKHSKRREKELGIDMDQDQI